MGMGESPPYRDVGGSVRWESKNVEAIWNYKHLRWPPHSADSMKEANENSESAMKEKPDDDGNHAMMKKSNDPAAP